MVADDASAPDPAQNPLRENERFRRANRIRKHVIRIRKQSGRLFSRRMCDLLEKAETISAIGSRTMVEPVLRGPKAVTALPDRYFATQMSRRFALLEADRGFLSKVRGRSATA